MGRLGPGSGAIIADAAWYDAIVDGHNMEPLQEDTEPGAFVAMCWECEGYLVYDPTENDMPYGQVWGMPCPGAPPVPIPSRRAELDLEAAVGWHRPRAYKPVIHEQLNWEDPETR